MTGLTHREWLAAEKARGDLARQTYQTEAAKRRERIRRQLKAAHAKLDAIEAAEREGRKRQRQAGKVRAPIGNPLALARARGKTAKATSGRGA